MSGIRLAALLLAGLVFGAAGAEARDNAPFERVGATWRAIVETGPIRQADDSLVALAQDFLAFRQKLVRAANFRVENPRHVRDLLSYLQIEDERRLIRSWFAHHALTAAETPAYIVGVRSLLETHEADELLELLGTEKRFARFRIPGAEQALERIQAEKQSDRILLQRLTDFLLETARAWHGRKWGQRHDGGGGALPAVLVQMRRLAAHAVDAGAGGFVGKAQARAYTPTDLILTLAARRILGETLDEVGKIEHPDALRCLRWARLNLDQCMVSSHTPAEEAWCAGVHGVEEVSACWRFLLPDAE